MIRVTDTIAACRDLGLVCRFDHTSREYRLAWPVSSYRGYARKDQLALQELHAYYDSDPLAIINVARAWTAHDEAHAA